MVLGILERDIEKVYADGEHSDKEAQTTSKGEPAPGPRGHHFSRTSHSATFSGCMVSSIAASRIQPMRLRGRRHATNAPTIRMASSAANRNRPMSLNPIVSAGRAAASTSPKYRPSATNNMPIAHNSHASQLEVRQLMTLLSEQAPPATAPRSPAA